MLHFLQRAKKLSRSLSTSSASVSVCVCDGWHLLCALVLPCCYPFGLFAEMSPCTLSFGNPGSYTLFSINACYLAPKSSFFLLLLLLFVPNLVYHLAMCLCVCVCRHAFVLFFCFYKLFRMRFSLSTFDLYATFCALSLFGVFVLLLNFSRFLAHSHISR